MRFMNASGACSGSGIGQAWSRAVATPQSRPRSPDRRLEDDHVTDLRIAEAVADTIDDHSLADLERRQHRPGGDLVGLRDRGLDPERQPDRERHEQD